MFAAKSSVEGKPRCTGKSAPAKPNFINSLPVVGFTGGVLTSKGAPVPAQNTHPLWQPSSVTTVYHPSASALAPSPPAVNIKPTLRQDAAASPPTREGGCAVHIAKSEGHTKSIARRSITLLQKQAPGKAASCTCGDCKSIITRNVNPLTCGSCNTSFHLSYSGLTGDAAATTLARNSWICGKFTMTPQ